MSAAAPRKRASGCLFGMAFGDALGAATEFLSSVESILESFPPNGPQELQGDPARVTDDTQMALAVGEALLAAKQPYTAAGLEPLLRENFVAWSVSPENNRAPGMTCLNACERLATGMPWEQATVQRSKGCGANMRVAPVGLLSFGQNGEARQQRAAIAQFQAALTHGHPTALAAADLTAAAIADLFAGGDPAGLPQRLRAYALSQREVYHADWLGSLWQRESIRSPQNFIAGGWDECLRVLDRLDEALDNLDRNQNPCRFTGEGWIAEEAFATGLLCFLMYPDDPVVVVRRAAVTSGDSDSLACLAGAFAGAHLGLDAWPVDWVERIEYHGQLTRMGQAWDK